MSKKALEAQSDEHRSSISANAGSSPAEGATRKSLVRIPGSQGEGLTHDEFEAVNGLAPLPAIKIDDSKPLLVYEKAVMAIRDCRTIDDAKFWSDKSEALQAWARMYADDRIMREARALKLHAYRRIGQLADALRISMPKGSGYRGLKGSVRGARSLLIEHGVSTSRSQHMLTIGRMDQDLFDGAVSRDKPPSPSQLCDRELRPNPLWATVGNRLSIFLSAIKSVEPESLARTLDEKQRKKALRMIDDAFRWLYELEEKLSESQEGSG